MDEHLYILSPHFEIPQSHKNSSVDVVGQKARGLLDTESSIIPPFLIVTADVFKLWHEKNQAEAEEILNGILEECRDLFEKDDIIKFIVRSSAKFESFEERGHYESSRGNISFNDLATTIKEIWYNNAAIVKEFAHNRFAVIIQKYIRPLYLGHVSNERRLTRERKKYVYEIVDSKDTLLDRKAFVTNNLTEGNISKEGLRYHNKRELIAALKKLASYLSLSNQRRHIEWVADKNNVWLVQNDIENVVEDLHYPGAKWSESKPIIERNELKSFSLLSTTQKSWKKIKSVQTFLECGLPYGQIYILEDEHLLANIVNGKVDEILKEDLEWLLQFPIVIRTDIQNADGYNNILLPRTDTLFNLESAIDALQSFAGKFVEQNLSTKDFCFLIHRFINARACALAFSKPGIPRTRIDSTWGIVEGLYYHPHDSFEINQVNRGIKKKIRCKTEYIDVDEKGNWISIRANSRWDWAESLTRKQLLDIATYNSKIADRLNSPVTVMYFIGANPDTGYPEILPWFYTTDEITASSEKFTDIIFSERREVIQNENDLKKLKLKLEGQEGIKTTIKLKLNTKIVRDKELIEDIGSFAREKKIPLELEGSILSHTYYILKKMGAIVKCIDPFEPIYEKQKFYKLVRDKIAVNIQSKGEDTTTIQVETNQLLDFLKEKAIEEALEFFWEYDKDNMIEEMADIFEVLRSACKLFNIDIDELNKIAETKTRKKGGFEKGVLLLDTTEASLIDIEDSETRKRKNKKLSSKTLKLNKQRFKIQTNSAEDSILIPYIIGGFQKHNNPKQIRYSATLDNRIIEIVYSNGGIKIFLDRDKSYPNPSQLKLFEV